MLPFTAAVLVALGAVAQINPVWLFGPYQPGSISAGSVPDWYMGFLDGALRVMPSWELSFGGHPLSLDVLIPAVIVPGLFFTLVAAYPLLDGWIAGGRPPRGLLPPRPADPANRIGVGVAGITLYGLLWAAAANDEIAYHLQVSLYTVTWVFRVLVLTGPVLAFALTRMICHVVEARRQRRGRARHRDRPDRDDPGGRLHRDPRTGLRWLAHHLGDYPRTAPGHWRQNTVRQQIAWPRFRPCRSGWIVGLSGEQEGTGGAAGSRAPRPAARLRCPCWCAAACSPPWPGPRSACTCGPRPCSRR